MNLVFLGPPGSGKGTQAARVASRFGLSHLSTGDILREAVKHGTELGEKADGYILRGELVPDDLIVGLIEEMVTTGELKDGFILDGFPRTISQAENLDEMFHEHEIRLDRVILFKVSEREILKRLEGRARVENRADDTREVIENRLQVYKDQTQPIEQYYRNQSILVDVHGEDSPDEVFDSVLKVAGN